MSNWGIIEWCIFVYVTGWVIENLIDTWKDKQHVPMLSNHDNISPVIWWITRYNRRR